MTVTIDRLRIGIRTNDPSITDDLLRLLPPGWKVSSSRHADRVFSVRVGRQRGRVRQFHLLFNGWVREARSEKLQDLLDAFEREVRMYVAQFSKTRVYVHAGVVALNGAAIVIPGASYSGKTSLVRALLEAGATYVSDEYAALDSQGRVHPFAVPLGVRPAGEPFPRQEGIEASSFGAPTARRPLPVAAVVVTRYTAGATFTPRTIGGGEAALELLKNCVSAQRDPARSSRFIAAMLTGITKLKGPRGEASEAAAAITSALSRGEGHDQRKIA